MEKRPPEQLEITAAVGGIDNQTYSIKSQLVLGLSDVELSVSGISSFHINPKEIAGEGFFRHMVQKQLNDRRIKPHDPSLYLDLS